MVQHPSCWLEPAGAPAGGGSPGAAAGPPGHLSGFL